MTLFSTVNVTVNKLNGARGNPGSRGGGRRGAGGRKEASKSFEIRHWTFTPSTQWHTGTLALEASWVAACQLWRCPNADGIPHCVTCSAFYLEGFTLPALPHQQLSSILSSIEGGQSIPNPGAASWPPYVTETWCPKGLVGIHGDGLLPVISPAALIAMPDCLSRSGWVQRKLKQK